MFISLIIDYYRANSKRYMLLYCSAVPLKFNSKFKRAAEKRIFFMDIGWSFKRLSLFRFWPFFSQLNVIWLHSPFSVVGSPWFFFTFIEYALWLFVFFFVCFAFRYFMVDGIMQIINIHPSSVNYLLFQSCD